MSASVWPEVSELSVFADTALKLAARFWALVTVASQWLFLGYVIAFYGGSALLGNVAAWNRVIPNGHAPGATVSNVFVAVHLVVGVILMAGGPLQLMPNMRRLAPSFHRWNGRLYVLTLFISSITGLHMIWSRGHAERVLQHLGVSLHATLIMAFATLSVRYAVGRNLNAHQRWALRLFMVVNAGWLFRVGVMHRVFHYARPAGFDPLTFTDPLLNFLAFADYLLPLAVLEIYLHARDDGGAGGRLAVAAVVVMLTVAMGVGMFEAAHVLWLPRINSIAS